MMLRITETHRDARAVVLKLEGRVVSEWDDVLERHCGVMLDQDRAVSLDLSAVTYVDRRGLGVLNRLRARGIRLDNASPLLSELLSRSRPDDLRAAP